MYPGFLQLSGFMSMNLDRHVQAHKDLFSISYTATAIWRKSIARFTMSILPSWT